MKRGFRKGTLALSLGAVAVVLLTVWGGSRFAPLTSAAVQGETVTAIPLYRLVHKLDGFHFYTVDAHEKEVAVKYGHYQEENIAGYVLPKPANGTVPLYRLSAATYGCYSKLEPSKFFYTTDKAARDKAAGSGWHLDGVVGFVPPPDRGLPGTVPLYRMYHDLSECKKKSSIQVFNLPDRPKASIHTGDDDNFYSTSEAEMDQATHQGGYQTRGVACYVWTGPIAVAMYAPPTPLPDLIVPKVFTEESSVKAIVLNQGKYSVSSVPGVLVRFLVYDRAGKVVFKSEQNIGGMSSSQDRPTTFDTTKLANTVGLHYQVVVDPDNIVKESNDSNNASADTVWGIKIKPDPNAATRVPSPSIAITSKQASGSTGLPYFTNYTLNVLNWNAYKPDLYQSLAGVMPAVTCGTAKTDSRMLLQISTLAKVQSKVICRPLSSGKDMATLQISFPLPLLDSDRVQVTLEDRLIKMKYVSEPYAVGWLGVDKVLVTVGCKRFLGRAGNFLCTTDQGMSACENLKTQGKPIQCTRPGKK